MNALVQIESGKAVTTSRKIAAVFGKRHADVLRAIENLKISAEFRERNFRLSEYRVSGNNKTYPEYLITRDGFAILAMGFTGAKADKFKEDYINAYNELERRSVIAMPLNYPDALRRMAILVEQGKSIEQAYALVQPKGRFGEISKASGNPKTSLIPPHFRSNKNCTPNELAMQYLQLQITFPFFALLEGDKS